MEAVPLRPAQPASQAGLSTTAPPWPLAYAAAPASDPFAPAWPKAPEEVPSRDGATRRDGDAEEAPASERAAPERPEVERPPLRLGGVVGSTALLVGPGGRVRLARAGEVVDLGEGEVPLPRRGAPGSAGEPSGERPRVVEVAPDRVVVEVAGEHFTLELRP